MDTTRQEFRAAFARRRVAYRDYVEFGPQTYRWYRIATVDDYAPSQCVQDAVRYAYLPVLDPLQYPLCFRLRMRRRGLQVRL